MGIIITSSWNAVTSPGDLNATRRGPVRTGPFSICLCAKTSDCGWVRGGGGGEGKECLGPKSN